MLGHHFVLGETIADALRRARAAEARGFRHSYDMLGEGARTAADAERYFASYAAAIEAIGKAAGNERAARPAGHLGQALGAPPALRGGASAKRVMRELVPRLLRLARAAKRHDLNLTVDAEEADRLEFRWT